MLDSIGQAAEYAYFVTNAMKWEMAIVGVVIVMIILASTNVASSKEKPKPGSKGLLP